MYTNTDIAPLSRAAQTTKETIIYYLAPEFVEPVLMEMREYDKQLFEYSVIHHDNVVKMSPKAFQYRFNDELVNTEGYIVVK